MDKSKMSLSEALAEKLEFFIALAEELNADNMMLEEQLEFYKRLCAELQHKVNKQYAHELCLDERNVEE